MRRACAAITADNRRTAADPLARFARVTLRRPRFRFDELGEEVELPARRRKLADMSIPAAGKASIGLQAWYRSRDVLGRCVAHQQGFCAAPLRGLHCLGQRLAAEKFTLGA